MQALRIALEHEELIATSVRSDLNELGTNRLLMSPGPVLALEANSIVVDCPRINLGTLCPLRGGTWRVVDLSVATHIFVDNAIAHAHGLKFSRSKVSKLIGCGPILQAAVEITACSMESRSCICTYCRLV